MIILELIKILKKYPQDMQVIADKYSDYSEVVGAEILEVIEHKDMGYFQRVYGRLENSPDKIQVLYLDVK